MSEDTLRVGLVGVGGVCAKVHYPGLRLIEGVEIVGICEPSDTLRQKRQADWGIDAAFGELDELLTAVKPDAVFIATPNVYHQELIFAALDAGCHVICEKPLGMNFAQTQEIYARGKASGKRHMTAFTYRFVPAMNYIRHLVQTGALGQIRHARFQRLQDWGERAIGWRQYKDQAGSGELGDMGIHRLDFAEDLLGPIAAVCGHAKQLVPRDITKNGDPCPPQDVEDWIAWIAEFESGTTGVFEMGKLANGHGPKGDHDQAEFNGTEASAVYQLHNPHEILFAPRGEPYQSQPVPDDENLFAPYGEPYQSQPVPEEFLKRPGAPRDPAVGDPVVTFRYDQAWEFVSAIRAGRDCVPSFYHGMRAQAVADSILEAAATRRWVDIPDCPV